MQLVSRSPRDPRLRGLVRALWHCRAPKASGLERMLPSGEMQLIVNLRHDSLRFAQGMHEEPTVCGGALVQGMQSQAVVLDRADQRDVAGVVLEPGAGRVLLGTALDAWTDTHADLGSAEVRGEIPLREHLCGAGFGDPLFDRWEGWLVAQVRGRPDPMIRAALGLMRGGQHRVAALASDLGSSERAFRRRFRAEVGLAPKQMSRVFRLQRALVGLQGGAPLVEVALSCGFHDQAHFTHELRGLAGVTPSEYRRRSPASRNHLG